MNSNPESSSRVCSIQLNERTRRPMRSVDHATAVTGAGLVGCRHCRTGNDRSILLIESETLDCFGLAPGEIKENIATAGIELGSLPPGACLQIGDQVVVEITGACEPCSRMDEIRAGLRAELDGRRGMNARVVVGGEFSVGAEIKRVAHKLRAASTPCK